MTITWTLFNSAGPVTPNPGITGSQLALSYDDEGALRFDTTQIVTGFEYSGEDDPVRVVLTKAGDNWLDASKTSVTRSPVSAPDATWTGGSTSTAVTLSFPNPTTNTGTSWLYDLMFTRPIAGSEPIALKVKVVVKRPPDDPRP